MDPSCTPSLSNNVGPDFSLSLCYQSMSLKSMSVIQSCAGCRYCGPIKPVFADVTAALQGDHCIVAAAVDCTDETELAIQCNVDGLPTMLFFWNGEQTKTVRYRGDWSEADMRLFAVRTSASAHEKSKKVRKTGGVAGKKHRGQVRKRKNLKFRTKKTKKKQKKPVPWNNKRKLFGVRPNLNTVNLDDHS